MTIHSGTEKKVEYFKTKNLNNGLQKIFKMKK